MPTATKVTLDVIEVKYSLAELPSSQHRAGLAGLLLLIDHIAPRDGAILEAVDRNEGGFMFRCNSAGMEQLFDELYSASTELVPSSSKRKDDEPAKIEETEFVDEKTKKAKKKTLYYYPTVIPKASFVDRYDDSPKKLWLKLWRDMVWTIMRGVPAQRGPFNDRAAGKSTADASEAFKQLAAPPDGSIKLPSTYFLGAQERNADDVPFFDTNKWQFLLHFWIYACQIHVPLLVDRDGKRNFQGFVIAVPDVINVQQFCSEFLEVLRKRDPDANGYVPAGAVVDIPEESALEFIRRLYDSLADRMSTQEVGDLVHGFDIFHTEKIGNNIRLHYCGRIEPERHRDADYGRLRKILRNHQFRRQRLINLVRNHPWWHGYDGLMSTLPIEQCFLSPWFSADVRTNFKLITEEHKEMLSEAPTKADSPEGVCLEELVLKITQNYVKRKLKDKYGLEYSKENESERGAFNDKKEAIGKEAFYAIRSRSGEDFINYFASTICAVPHWLTQNEFVALTKELYDKTEKVRTLTMLALSARVARMDNKQGET